MRQYDPSKPPIIWDSETCSLHSVMVLLQYAVGDGPITLYEVWNKPIQETLDLLTWMCEYEGGWTGFNLSFDAFHLAKLGTTLLLMSDKTKLLKDCIEEFALKEPEGRDGPCFKPVRALDLMLHARKGEFQKTMNRGDVNIRRVPSQLSYLLAAELDRRIPLDDILFARQKVHKRWSTYPIEDEYGEVDPEFRNVVLKFAPSSGLKSLASAVLDAGDDVTKFDDIECPAGFAVDLGYAPFALAIGKPGEWNGAWPDKILAHIEHWATNEKAREYATNDIVFTRGLFNYFDKPALGDDDSELACMVAAVRWRGFQVDIQGLQALKEDAERRSGEVPTAPTKVKPWIHEKLSPAEILASKGSTKRTILETLMEQVNMRCGECDGDDAACLRCQGTGMYDHPAAERARQVLAARQAKYEANFYEKLILAGRLHADLNVIGALSSRMSGAGGVNVQGIKRSKEVREKFPLAWDGFVLCGGDFSGFEVVLAEACYNDPDLRRDLLWKRPCLKCTKGEVKPTCDCDGGVLHRGTDQETWCTECLNWTPRDGCDDCWGTGLSDTKIHALFGQFVYPDMTYEQIMKDKEKYTRCKSAVFALLYGGEGFTLQTRLGVDIEVANAAHAKFCQKYPGVGRAQKRINDLFCTLKQDEMGGQITWSEPADYIESMFGFRRYFTVENRISKALFDMAQKPPSTWRKLNIRVTRRKDRGEQTAGGATQSALFGAAFALQASNKRAAGNHEIQSSGATITKAVQRKVWDFQPGGVESWMVIPLNIHDEIMVPCRPELVDAVKTTVDGAVEGFRSRVPLIKIVWATHLESWAEK